ncbi:MAG: hypothetical protein JXX28_13865 [Deltaproteobacteria bacterium]|nr:hypothetical protein [Deltaproteobacteria bacterium]
MSDAAARVVKLCDNHDLTAIILSKRAAENYLPDCWWMEAQSLAPCNRKWTDAIDRLLAMSPEARDFQDMGASGQGWKRIPKGIEDGGPYHLERFAAYVLARTGAERAGVRTDLDRRDPAGDLHMLVVLDGQQRLTTLAGVLLQDAGLTREEGPDPDRWRVFFDAGDGEDGVFTHLAEPANARPWQVSLHHLMSTRGFFDQVGKLYHLGDDALPVQRDVLIERLQQVSRALQSYKVPVTEFRTDDLNLAVESFARLNRKGISIAADEMFSALTYVIGTTNHAFDVARGIDRVLDAVRATGFGEVDRMVVLRTFLVTAGLDPFRTDWTRIGKELRARLAKDLPEAITRAERGLLRAIQFLRAEHIHNERMLPYGLQLIGLAVWLAEDPTPSDKASHLLRKWLWLTGFASWFGQGNPSRYARLLAELRDVAKAVASGEDAPEALSSLPWTTPLTPFPSRFDFRSARVRTLVCLLARRGALDAEGRELASAEVGARILQHGPAAMRTLWTGDDRRTKSPANRMFNVFGEDRRQARTQLRASPPSEEFCRSHLLPFPPRWTDMSAILEQREREMMDLEAAFLVDLGFSPSVSHAAADSPIDREDEPIQLTLFDGEED